MQIENGITTIIQLYNFINENLLKEEVKVRKNEDIVEFTQDGRWVMVPEFLHEVIIVPKRFKEGYIRKSDLVKLYNQLAFVAQKRGRLPIHYTDSYISPEVFGFSVWSRYPKIEHPGVKLVSTFQLKVRNKFGFVIK